MMHTFTRISSSAKGRSLIFPTKAEYDAYDNDILDIIKKHKQIQQFKYGYWATNQEIFVKSPEDLSEWDSKDYYV